MNEEAIKDAYGLFSNTGYNGSYNDFKKLIQTNASAKKDAYGLFAGTGYNGSEKDFDTLMGVGQPVKKKESVSPSQQKQQATSLATGPTPVAGASVPSAKQGPSLQEQLQASVNLAAGAAVASSKPGFKPVPKEEADKALYGKARVQEGTLGVSGGRTKEVIAKDIKDKYSNLGVRVEQVPVEYRAVGAGDLRVIADDGSQIDIDVSEDSKKSAKEEAKLQTFLMGKSAGVEKAPVSPMEFLMMSRDGISPQEEAKFKRVYSQELVDGSIKFVNNELEKTKVGVDKIQAEINKLQEDALVGGITPEMESRFSDLKSQYDSSVGYAKSIASLADEGIKMAAGENVKILAENGSVSGGLYNALLKGTKMLVEGSADIVGEGVDILSLGAIGDVNPSGVSLYTYDKKKERENTSNFLNSIYDDLKSKGTTTEYTTTGNMAWKALFSVPEMIPSLVVPGGASARIAAMWSQGVGRRYEEMDSNPKTKDLPEEEKFFMAAGPAYVEARLENFGLTQWLGANKGVASSIFLKAVSKVAPSAGVKGLNKLINAEINNLVLRGAVNTAGAVISEAETGALQNISDTAFRDAYEIAKGKDLFNQPGFSEDGFTKALLEDALMEGLGGMWMAGAANIAQQTSEYAVGKTNTNETFKLVKDILASNTSESALISTLKSQMLNGKVSKEQAQNTIRNFREAKAIVKELPADLSEDSQRAAFDLLSEKRKLINQIEGKDPSLVDKQKKRIAVINNELITISNAVQEQTTSEVPVQPEAVVGQEVVEGKPQPGPEVATEEGEAKEEVTPGGKAVVSGIEITYPTEQEKTERQSVRNEKSYVAQKAVATPQVLIEEVQSDLDGQFAMVTAENPMAQPLTEEENTALNNKAEQWLKDRGYSPKKIVGKYDQAENSFFVKDMTKEDALAFAKEFNQESVAHSEGLIYQTGKMNPRDMTQDNFSLKNYVPGDNYVSVINTPQGPKTFAVGYDFNTENEFKPKGNIQDAVNNSAQSLNMVAPDLKVIVAENTEDAQLQIAEALSAIAPGQAADTAEKFTTETKGQTVFVNGKPFAVVFNKESADSQTVGHEAWEVMLNDAFGNDQAKFKEFRDSIDRQLRLNGFEAIADELTKFSNQRGYEDVKYSEYMAELGGMLVANGFDKGTLSPQQKTLLQKIGDVINKFAQLFTGKKQFLDEATPDDILGFMITISDKVAKGEDVSGFFRGKVNEVEGVTSRSQIDQRLSEPGISVPKNEKLSAKINPSKEGDVMKQIDALLDKYPNALKDRGQWKELMSRVFSYKGPDGEVMIPKFPEALSRMSNSVEEVLKELEKVSPKQRELASSGLEGTKEIGKLYEEGKMDDTDTGLYFLWNIMSIGISPYPQEAGFLRAVENGVDSFIKKSADGKFLSGKEIEYNGEKIDSGLAEYYDWVDRTLPKGVAGSGSKANLRSFGSAFLSKASTKIEIGEFKGLTKMQALHKILSDRTTPTNELRRKWLSNLSGMSFNNKIFDFILLTTGRSDLFVIDRVRTEHFWDSDKLKKDSGLKPTTSIYDGSELSFGKTTGAGYSKMLSDVPGMVFAELANRTMQPVVKEAYEKIGVKDSPDVGRFHWETWVAASSQEVSHGSIDAIVQRKNSGEIKDAGIRQGKYGAWDFNFAYRKRSGKPFMYEFTDEYGNTYEFDDISAIYEEISNQNQKKNYGNDSDRFILKDENGNIIKRKTEKIDNAWYDQPGVDKQKYFDYLKSKAKKVIPAPNVIEDQGVVIKNTKVTTRSQKSVPAVVDEVLTDDGKGNYVFVHYSDEKRDTIKPMSGSKKNFTSREEVSAISSVGGVAMYYTKQGQKEQGVGNEPHTVLVPKDKVYFYGTTERGKVSNDPENFEPEARRRFQEYKNRGNEARPTEYAFDSNNSAAWVTKVASENGYDMVVTNWGGPKSYRAQTVKELTPEADYQGFKEIPDDVFEVGDEVFLNGRYGNVTGVDGDTLTIESENRLGSFDKSKFQLTKFTRDRILLVNKAKPTVTTRSQKVVVNTIPGYERFLGVIEGMIDKSIKSGTSYNKTTENVIEYIQINSAVYRRADDSQREQIIRDFVKIRGEKFKTAPSVARIMGEIKNVKEVTVKEATALKDQIKLEAKAAKDAVAFVKGLRMQISSSLKGMVGRGVISAKQAATILSRYDSMNILNPVMRERFVDYVSKVFQTAEYKDKLAQASKLRRSISRAAKSEQNQAEVSKIAKDFNEINPAIVQSIDDYINVAEALLASVARTSKTPLMRDVANLENLINYIDEEVQAQREQIKNEILNKYQDLVDAGVLSSKMTINEIKNVVAAIEEKENTSEKKIEEARSAVKEMMAEMSPLIKQIVRTGADPFTGEPIDLTRDEKVALMQLADMDTDSLGLSEAIKAVEYANNFIANGITSGVVGLAEAYQGSLNATNLKQEGFKSATVKKYFFKSPGRVWLEQIATLPMLNRIMWVTSRRALDVMDKSGVAGVSTGKAKAIKIVDKIVNEYTSKFSKIKDFLTAENIIERGMFAFVSRTVIGDEFQAQAEFNRRKSLVEQTIQALKDPENNTDAEIKKGETIEKVYNKILKDAKNIADVNSKVNETNKKAVEWWVAQWASKYDRMDEVSRNVYNTLLSRDANYTPDRFQMKEAPAATEEDFDSSFFGNFEYVNASKSGSLRENNRIKDLPKDKNGVKTRIVNLDFDTNNVNAMTSAMVDVETAGSIAKIKGFITSKDFSKLFSSSEDAKLYKKRTISYVNFVKGGGYVDQGELAKLNQISNAIASLGTAKALFSAAQIPKQFVPPMLNTLAQTGRFDIAELFNGAMKFIDESGYPISTRGVGSQGELKSINRKLEEADRNLAIKGIKGILDINNEAVRLVLQYPDMWAARSSWVSFYIHELKKQGIPTKNIDWSSHELNKKAADYAQLMVDSQQNISDTDMQGDLFTSKKPAVVFLRRSFFPLMSFTLNQKTRIWADAKTISSKVSSTQDKIDATKSISGAIVEQAVFAAIRLAVLRALWYTAKAIWGDDEDDEEYEKKQIMRQASSTAQNFMKDFLIPPIPYVDLKASEGINVILEKSGLSESIPRNWYGIEDEEARFNFYVPEKTSVLDQIGTQGIAAEKFGELYDNVVMATTGKFSETYGNYKVKKQILEEDKDAAAITAAVLTASTLGVLPSEFTSIANIINKKIKRRAENVDED